MPIFEGGMNEAAGVVEGLEADVRESIVAGRGEVVVGGGSLLVGGEGGREGYRSGRDALLEPMGIDKNVFGEGTGVEIGVRGGGVCRGDDHLLNTQKGSVEEILGGFLSE